MSRRITNLETWRRRGDVDYVRLEARPTRRKADESNVVSVRLDFIPPGDFPHSQPSGAMLDSGNYQGAQSRLLERIDYAGFRERQRQAFATGRRLGLGLGFIHGPVEIPAVDHHALVARLQPRDDVHAAPGHPVVPGEEFHQRRIGLAVDRPRRQPDLDALAMAPGELVARGARLHVHLQHHPLSASPSRPPAGRPPR